MMAVSYIASQLTGGASQVVDEELLTPLFQSKEYKEKKQREKKNKYLEVKQQDFEVKPAAPTMMMESADEAEMWKTL